MYKKILIPLDNSPTDAKILEHIRPLAKMTKAHLVLMHVADGFAARLQNELDLADSEEMNKDHVYLNTVRDALAAEDFKVKAILIQGKEPVDGILAVAEQEGCDLIAMSTHGHGFIKDVILGSVADTLRHRTDIPILMIRASVK